MCPICESPHRAEIDTALRTGRGYKALARRFGLDVDAVKGHRRQCLSTRPTSQPTSMVGPLPLREPYRGPAGAPAPAREGSDPRAAVDFDTRVAFIVSEMATGTFDAPRDTAKLAGVWGISHDATRRIVRAAGSAFRCATPDLDTVRAVSQGRWMHLTREALDVAALCVACPEVPRAHVAAVVAAVEAELDRRLSEVSDELPPPSFPVPLADVLAAQDAMRQNTGPPS